MRFRLGTIKWHQHASRQVAICLHRLHSGDKRLNVFNHRIDPEADPSCRFGCAAIKNTRHILESCLRNEVFRFKIHQFFSCKNLELNTNIMLGLNPAIDTDSQLKIRNLTTQFLTQSALINIISQAIGNRRREGFQNRLRTPQDHNGDQSLFSVVWLQPVRTGWNSPNNHFLL
jgi:hypothetical protein